MINFEPANHFVSGKFTKRPGGGGGGVSGKFQDGGKFVQEVILEVILSLFVDWSFFIGVTKIGS